MNIEINENSNMIENQSSFDIMYGGYPSSYNGCAWIALFNMYVNRVEKCDKLSCSDSLLVINGIIRELEKRLCFNGKFGTSIFSVEKYMNDIYKKDAQISFWKKDLENLKDGIIYFFNGKAIHFSYFNKKDGKFIFHNINGKYVSYDSIKDFINNNCILKVCMIVYDEF